MYKNNFNKCCGIASIAVVVTCASAFAHDESAGRRNENKETELAVCCYPLLAADDSARRAQQQAELRRREYQRREAEEAEENRARQQAELKRREYQRREAEEAEANRRESARRSSTENGQQAASQAREKRERQNVCDQKTIKEVCDADMAAPKIGMTLDQAHACFRDVRPVGKWSSSNDSEPALIYRAGRYHLFVTNCRVIDWY